MNNNLYNVSIMGSCIAFMSGASLCTGLNLLCLYYNIVVKDKRPEREYIVSLNTFAFVGGGLTSFGLYLIVPNKIRTLWF